MALRAAALAFLLALCPVPDLLAATWVYTANEGDGTVSVIDADAGKKRATIRGLRAPHNIHLGPDGMLYVTDGPANQAIKIDRSEEHTSELQSRPHLVCRLLLEKKKTHRARAAQRSNAPRPRAI